MNEAGGVRAILEHLTRVRTHYRALRREELSRALTTAGFREVRWRLPEESGFYQPLVTARRAPA